MRISIQTVPLAIVAIVAATSCGTRPGERAYRLQGQVQSIDRPRRLVVVKHEEIRGFMPAMTMPYEVQKPEALDPLSPGDLVDATLLVFSNGAYLTRIRKVGQAPLEKPPLNAGANADAEGPAPGSGTVLLKPGDVVPDSPFVDQNGRKRRFEDFKGSRVVMTFIYTRCPLPTFCPLMDRYFAALQKSLRADPALEAPTRVRLVTVSFDPVTDTPAVLREHAARLQADPTRWTFLTGDRDAIDRFAARFGVSISRALNDPRDITHNLRTVIVGADGRLVKVYTGNDWRPEEVLADLKRTDVAG